jgi:ABC-type uncharacterized transport system substrate-binding protein
VKRAAVIRNTEEAAGTAQFAAVQAVAPALGVEVSPIGMRDMPEIERATMAFARGPKGSLIVTANAFAVVHRHAAFRQGLEKRGWSEGRNVRIDYRYAPAGAQAQVLAKELVALQPDVIFAQTTPITAALQRESRTVPIVFAAVSDPIGSGFIASLPRPGGNITGVMLYEASVIGKWLAMLQEIAPSLVRAAFVANPKTATFYNYYLRAGEALAPSLGIALVPTLVEKSQFSARSRKKTTRRSTPSYRV